MNPITLPLLITIAVVGIIAIIAVKLFYKDKEASDLSDELPPKVSAHWEESFDKNHLENDDYGFVTKSWEEPREKQRETKNGIASKVFQEPMNSKHQDIISNDYLKESIYTPIQSSINNNSASIRFDGYDENNLKNDFEDKNEINYNRDNTDDFNQNDLKNSYNNKDKFQEERKKTNSYDENLNTPKQNENKSFEDKNGSFSIRKPSKTNHIYNDFRSEYITPKKYYSHDDNDYTYENNSDKNNDEPNENKYELDTINPSYSDSHHTINPKNIESNKKTLDSLSSKNSSENYNENNSLNDIGGMDIGEQVIIGGKPQTIKLGDEIIFNYSGESYSSRILEIKHENIKVKYRAQEKWISFSDIKKVF